MTPRNPTESQRRMPSHSTLSKTARIAVLIACASTPAFAAGGARGIEVALPAYVFADDPFLQDLKNPVKTPVPPAIVVLNIGNGDVDVSQLDPEADALRQRVTASGERVKVIGYVYTSKGLRDDAAIRESIGRYLQPRNGAVHFDGIFFDEVPRECGPTPGSMEWRDKYRSLREYIWSSLPRTEELVVNNVGTAVFDCYLETGHDTADTFITFEDSAAHYMTDALSVGWKYGWLGGNVVQNNAYLPGEQYGSWRFWHLVYGVDANNWATVVQTAIQRYAGYVDATDDIYSLDSKGKEVLNPWDRKPAFLNDEIGYAGSLSAPLRR